MVAVYPGDGGASKLGEGLPVQADATRFQAHGLCRLCQPGQGSARRRGPGPLPQRVQGSVDAKLGAEQEQGARAAVRLGDGVRRDRGDGGG